MAGLSPTASAFVPNKLRSPPTVVNLVWSCAAGCPGGTSCSCVTLLHPPSPSCNCPACSEVAAIWTAASKTSPCAQPVTELVDTAGDCYCSDCDTAGDCYCSDSGCDSEEEPKVEVCDSCCEELTEHNTASWYSGPACDACLDDDGYSFADQALEGTDCEVTPPWWFPEVASCEEEVEVECCTGRRRRHRARRLHRLRRRARRGLAHSHTSCSTDSESSYCRGGACRC